MQLFLSQQNYNIGDFKGNTQKIIQAIRTAKLQGADLVIFSELCVCGCAPKDLLYYNDFIEKCALAIEEIAQETDSIGVIIGAPVRNKNNHEKALYNAALLLHKKKIQGMAHKTVLSTCNSFDESRYFEPASSWDILHFKGKKIALTIGDDMCDLHNKALRFVPPMEKLIALQPDLMVNISASSFTYLSNQNQEAKILGYVKKYGMPMFFCNTVGAQTELVFDGRSSIFDKEGNLLTQLPLFQEAMQGIKIKDDNTFDHVIAKTAAVLPLHEAHPEALDPEMNIHQIYAALVTGIKDYFKKTGFKRAVVGSSGGLDSAVTLAIACDALGSNNVRAILMPSPYSSEHSVNDAVQLSKNLSNPYDIVHITDIYNTFLKELRVIFEDRPFSVAEENIQSRTRGNILMAVANKLNYLVLNTSNKSELAVGYGTLYGDMAGGIGILGDCYKLQVYALAKYINRNTEIIPANIIRKPPSAELRPEQKDTDSLPDYSVLDQVLYKFIEMQMTPQEIKRSGYMPDMVDRILKMVNINEYKRHQFCPIIRISSKAFGSDRDMPVMSNYLLK